jgi:uracil-DNA glycosylase family 4
MAETDGKPGRDCPRCPRLVAFRKTWREQESTWFNSPVPSFGSINGRLLVVGLAPGLQGANRTGRPFTGDYAGVLLYETLGKYGFACGEYRAHPSDGLELVDCRITNAVRCVPPENKPTPEEIRTCRDFLAPTIGEMKRLRAIVALGRIAHESTVRALGGRLTSLPFAHGKRHELGAIALFSSYHCSRYNTNTGVLTPAMFREVFATVRRYLDA